MYRPNFDKVDTFGEKEEIHHISIHCFPTLDRLKLNSYTIFLLLFFCLAEVRFTAPREALDNHTLNFIASNEPIRKCGH
jgi:hypothetical protein